MEVTFGKIEKLDCDRWGRGSPFIEFGYSRQIGDEEYAKGWNLKGNYENHPEGTHPLMIFIIKYQKLELVNGGKNKIGYKIKSAVENYEWDFPMSNNEMEGFDLLYKEEGLEHLVILNSPEEASEYCIGLLKKQRAEDSKKWSSQGYEIILE